VESVVGLHWAYTNKRQSAYATPNVTGDLIESHPFEGADFSDLVPNMSDNAAQYGKGHEFATRNEVLSWDVRMRRTFQATTKMLGWGFAFHCGKVTTTSLGSGAFQHVFEYQDPTGVGYYGSGRQQPVTTIMERIHPGDIREWPSMQVMAIEITGQLNDWIRLALDLIGSGKKISVSGFTFPTATEGALLRHASLLFEHGPSASLLDESCDVDSFRWRSEMAYDEVGGYCPGSGYQVSGDPHSGQIRNKLEFTRRAVLLEIVFRAKVGTQVQTRLENQSDLKALMTITGDTIGGGQSHKLIINIPRLRYRAAPVNTNGDVITYAVSTVVMYDAGLDNPWEATVINTTSSYLSP